MIFAFSMIWGFGASFNSNSQRFLDSIFRDFFGKCQIPPKETVFFYYYNPKEMMFKPWNDLVPEFEKRIVAPYDQLFVPTIDSVSSTKILNMLMDQGKKVFFTGGTGVGKSIIIQEYINSNIEAKAYAPIILNFSA
jgi:dynein heavy chain